MDTKCMLKDLEQAKPKQIRTLSLGTTWLFEPSINFYRETHGLNWLKEVDPARETYLRAVGLSADARPALTGLASLLSGKPGEWTAALEILASRHPDHAQVLYFLGFDRFQRKDMDGAALAFERLAGISPKDAMCRVFLGRIAAERGDRSGAFRFALEALRLDPSRTEAVTDLDTLLRSMPLEGWKYVEALDAATAQVVKACGDSYMRVVIANNAAFRIREAVSSFTSRGRGRMQYLVPGAPPEALRWMRRCVALYEEAVAGLPDDDAIAALPFRKRWVYAGVLNDAGLMVHYFAGAQDLPRAEERYLRAFRITGGAYMDAYFYNLQFLYGFERPGNEARWLKLAAVAKDSILKEDAAAEGGFAPDDRKRAAAERDYERLRDLLGPAKSDAAEAAEIPR